MGKYSGRRDAVARVSALAMTAAILAGATPSYAQAKQQGGSAPSAEGPAPAGDSTNSAGSDIVVTGSRITRDGMQAPTPVTVVGAQEIAAQAPRDLNDFVTQLPAVTGSSTPTVRAIQVSNGAAGLATPSLRTLGTNRTLILLDGQRSVPATQTGEPDVEGFPQQLISRIDVVTGGASAAWGSDALAGVINFVLDRKFTGFKAEASYGNTWLLDDASWKLQATLGLKFAGDRGHFLLSGELSDNKGIFGTDPLKPTRRDYQWGSTALLLNPAYVRGNGLPEYITVPNQGSASMTRGGLITAGPLAGTAFGVGGVPYQQVFGITAGGFNSGGNWQAAEVRNTAALDPVMNRQNVFGRLSFDVAPDINLYVQGSYSRSEVLSGSCGCITFPANLNVPVANAFIPATVAARIKDLGLTTLTMGSILDTRGTLGHVTRHVQRFVAGADAKFDVFGSTWNANAYVQHGRTDSYQEGVGVLNRANFARAIDSVVNSSGAIVCRSTLTNPNDGCVPWNLFGVGVVNDAMRRYSQGTASRHEIFTQDVASVSVNGSPFSTWAGPIDLAFGGEWRKESSNGTVDPIAAANGWQVGNFVPLKGHYTVYEGFIETQVPLAKNVAFADTLELNGAMRFTHYSTSGNVATWKLGAVWAPIPDIRFRVTRSLDIRAPNLSELFTNGDGTTGTANDPLNGNAPLPYRGLVVGNQSLRPEKANTLGAGVVLQPRFLEGFSASADYYLIKVKDIIGSISAQQILDRCYGGGGAEYCDKIIRVGDPRNTQAFTLIYLSPVNFISRTASGIDFEVSYRTLADRVIPGADGSLSLRMFATKFIKNIENTTFAPPVNSVGELSNTFGTTPKWKYSGTLTYQNDSFSVAITGRGVPSGTINNSFVQCTTGCPVSTINNRTIDNNHIDGAFYVDLGLTYKPAIMNHAFELFGSIRNIANKPPSVVPTGPGGNSYTLISDNPQVFDRFGRTFRVGVRVKM